MNYKEKFKSLKKYVELQAKEIADDIIKSSATYGEAIDKSIELIEIDENLEKEVYAAIIKQMHELSTS